MTHRFSPRPNRASQIGWLEWGPEAFERAKQTNRPILLGISAVWCHWCHVMDETTYSDPRVIELVREKFVPIRVDADRRPDVNARYNLGGWPTTAFLTPDGAIVTGATYVAPDGFIELLQRVDEAWERDHERIEAEISARSRTPASEAKGLHPPGSQTVTRILESIVARYDEEHGGFGNAPKFPQPGVLRFLLLEYRRDRAAGKIDERLYGMLARTALGMARGGMYDHAEGGFFRYSTTRDWSIPHFEKMAEDHAGLIRFYAELYRVSGNPAFAQTLRSALRWLRSTMRDPHTGLFAGSQDADEAYFALSLEERREREAPFVDRTIYTNWNAGLAAALIAASLALDDDALLDDAVRALDALEIEMHRADGTLLHFKPPGGSAQTGPLLADHAALLEANLDAHAATGEARFFERAVRLAEAAIASLRADSGAFLDRPAGDDPLGNLRLARCPLDDNGELADAFLRIAATTHEERYATIAREILTALAGEAEYAGPFAAPYARALVRSLAEPFTVTVVAAPVDGAELREAALRLADPLVEVHTIAPGDAEALSRAGFAAGERPLAYPCAGKRCGAPAQSAAQLAESYDLIRQLPVR